ncbi:MAG: NAD(P)-dependent oxidoreductase [Actinomycetes bacterium]
MTDQPTVALLGTGTMGAGMARNIAAAGLTLRVWNRTAARAEPLADVAEVAAGVAEAVQGADVVLTMLFDADSVAETMEEARGHLAAGAVWLQQSTVGLAGTDRLAALAGDLGVAFVDAPVLGTKTPAEQGTLVVLASGEEALRARCAPVFAAVGERTLWVDGETGASTLKLVVNNWVLALIEGIAESIALAEGGGLDPQLFLDAIKGGPTDTPYAQLKGSMIIDRRFAPSFALSGATKDAGLVLDLAAEAGVDLAVTEAVRRHMARAVEMGHGDEDMAATYYAHRGN